jgi:hypothetical protein
MAMKKNSLVVIALLVILLPASGQLFSILPPARRSFPKLQFSLQGGLNLFAQNGTDGDYVAGSNDFPTVPAYQSQSFGLGFAVFTSRSFSLGLDVRYGLSTQVDLRDPSDGETITVDTPENLIAVLNFRKHFPLARRFSLVVSLGGGVQNLAVKEKEYVSSLGSRIIITRPEKTVSPLAAGGIGLQAMLNRSLGLIFDLQALYVFREKEQMLYSPTVALVLKF